LLTYGLQKKGMLQRYDPELYAKSGESTSRYLANAPPVCDAQNRRRLIAAGTPAD